MKHIFTIILLFNLQLVFGQNKNLVPNPSFEDYTNCAPNYSGLHLPSNVTLPVYCNDWYQASTATSDYFNVCNGLNVSVPNNFWGYQTPRTGNAYCGLVTFEKLNSNYREYIQTKLQFQMISGHKYYVGYSINMACCGNSTLASSKLGVLFVQDSIEANNNFCLPYTPSLQSPDGLIFTDTANWVTISDYFTANGTERWMVLGSFVVDSLTDTISISNENYKNAYYLYDDICVLDIDSTPSSYATHYLDFCDGKSNSIEGRFNANAFFWNDGDTTQSKFPTTNGVFWVKSINYDSCKFHIDTFYVSFNKSPIEINLGADTFICLGQKISLDAHHELFTQYQWSDGSLGNSIEVTQPGTYHVYASTRCFYGTDTIYIRAVESPQVQLPNDTLLCNDMEELQLSYFQENMKIVWSTGAKDTCCITVNQPGTYTLEVTNECKETASANINIDFINCDSCIWVPNAFSPNGDGINDVFRPETDCHFKSYQFSIYNRYGELVYSTDNIHASWNGMYNGQPSELGVYFFYIRAAFVVEEIKPIIIKGDVTLLR